MKEIINFLLAGVGGQGTILASDVLVNVGVAGGYQAKQAEVHGMSQRGGSVVSHVRWGTVVHSPLVVAGEVDVYLAFEKLEALRHVRLLRHDTLMIVNLQAIQPITVTASGRPYPTDEHLRSVFAQITSRVYYVDGEGIAAGLGNARAANVVLLGALSAAMERTGITGTELPAEKWLEIITARVPAKYLELNRLAFLAGRASP